MIPPRSTKPLLKIQPGAQSLGGQVPPGSREHTGNYRTIALMVKQLPEMSKQFEMENKPETLTVVTEF